MRRDLQKDFMPVFYVRNVLGSFVIVTLTTMFLAIKLILI